MAANALPLSHRKQTPAVPFTRPAPAGWMPWHAIPFDFLDVANALSDGISIRVLAALMKMQFGKTRPPGEDPWCTDPVTIKELATACHAEQSASSVQEALKLFVELRLVAVVKPAEARKGGLPCKGFRTLRYRVLHENFGGITRSIVEAARERLVPTPAAEDPAAEDPAPPRPRLVCAPGKASCVKTFDDGTKLEARNQSALPLSFEAHETKTGILLDVFVESKTVTVGQIPQGRYIDPPQDPQVSVPADVPGGTSAAGVPPPTHQPAAVAQAPAAKQIQDCMADLRAPIMLAQAREIAGILHSAECQPLDIAWFCASVHQRAEREARKKQQVTWPVLKGMASDAARELWPQEAAARRRRTAETPSPDPKSELSPLGQAMKAAREKGRRR